MSKSKVTDEETTRYKHSVRKATIDEIVNTETGGPGFIQDGMAIAKAFLEARGLPSDATIFYRLLPNGEKEIVSRKAAEDLRRTNDKHRVGFVALDSWVTEQCGTAELDDEFVAAELICLGERALNPKSTRQLAVDAAVQFGRLAMIWGYMRDKDARQTNLAKRPRQELMRRAIEAWVAKNPTKKTAELLRILPICDHEEPPSEPNAGDRYLLWREGETICAMDDAEDERKYCRKSAFYEHVRAVRDGQS